MEKYHKRIRINRPIGDGSKKTYYWVKPADLVIIDPGYGGGDIHIYRREKTLPATELKQVLIEAMENRTHWDFYIDVHELGREITGKVITYEPSPFVLNPKTGKLELPDESEDQKRRVDKK